MRIDVTRLAYGLNRLEIEEPPAAVGLPVPSPAGDAALGVVFTGPVRTEFRITRSGDELLVDADVRGLAAMECARCLAPVTARIEADFRLFCRRTESGAGVAYGDPDDEADEGDVVHHNGRRLDLTEQVRRVMLLAVPMRPLCRESCRGLCAGCGADLNTESCTCASRPARADLGSAGRTEGTPAAERAGR